ncbi:MAG: hypothetical protein M0P74_11365, partial [Syntrophales bacterium]|jgi:hypothetical protein|nr:hypothetical protein [Syntrophales bacterium]
MKGLKFRSKKAAAFGCYGWSGESVKVIRAQLEAAGFQVVDDGLRCLWNPDADSIANCVEYGKKRMFFTTTSQCLKYLKRRPFRSMPSSNTGFTNWKYPSKKHGYPCSIDALVKSRKIAALSLQTLRNNPVEFSGTK